MATWSRRALAFCLIVLPTLANAEPIHNTQDEFTFSVPPGYQPIQLLPAGKAFYSFGRLQAGHPADGVLHMQAQDGVLARGPLDRGNYERQMRREFGANPISFEYRSTLLASLDGKSSWAADDASRTRGTK
jgi:hypothetical protein